MDREQIVGLLNERRFKELKEELGTMHPVDIVEVLD